MNFDLRHFTLLFLVFFLSVLAILVDVRSS
jgi:hypothetical protein